MRFFIRPLARVALLGLLISLRSISSAGYYAVTFSGGNIVTWSQEFGYQNEPYYYADGDPETYEGGWTSGPGEMALASGVITATYTWHTTTNEPTPAHVLIRESISGEWDINGPGTDPGTGSCTDGQGDSEGSQPTSGHSYRITWEEKDNPPAQFTTEVKGAEADIEPDYYDMGGSEAVTYSVHPIAIDILMPPGGDGAGNFLVGQKLACNVQVVNSTETTFTRLGRSHGVVHDDL